MMLWIFLTATLCGTDPQAHMRYCMTVTALPAATSTLVEHAMDRETCETAWRDYLRRSVFNMVLTPYTDRSVTVECQLVPGT